MLMPVIGVIDPSHTERKATSALRKPRWLSVDEILAKSLVEPPTWAPWTYELLAAAIRKDEDAERRKEEALTKVSVTDVVGPCPRGKVLQRLEDYVASADEFYAAMRGTMTHALLEKFPRPGSLAEARFYTTVNGITVAGSPDLVVAQPEGVIYDYKTTQDPPAYDYAWKDHRDQLQVYRFLVNNAESWKLADGTQDIPFNPRTLEIKHLVDVYLGPKWPKLLEDRVSRDVPARSGGTKRARVPNVLDDDEVLFGDVDLARKVKLLNQAMNAYPEWPEGNELVWGGDASWKCPGPPLCLLPGCLAKRYPDGFVWESGEKADGQAA